MSRKTSPTHVLLNQVTLAASSSSVVFSAIPQTYGDLVLLSSVVASGGANVQWILNGDTSNVTRVFMYGDGSSAASGAGTSNILSFTSAASASHPTSGHFMDYSAADKHKTMLVRTDYGGANGTTWAAAGRWASNTPITSITLTISSGNFSSGATFSLYGVIA
jgi:hypothetical protein